MKNYKLTLIGLTISVVVFLGTIISGIDIFEVFVNTLKSLEAFEIDELIFPAVIFGIFIFLDLATKLKFQKIEIEKAKIYKAMLSSTHHVLNNFLQKMQLFKITVEKTEEFPSKFLDLYDQITKDTIVQIEALSSVVSIDEATILASVTPQPDPQ